MEASALRQHTRAPVLGGRSPLLRLQSDERLIALTRRGQHGAFEVLVQRYQSRLLAFCRHMLASTEDAEDVLQEVFASAFNAIRADDRYINARPWLYRIARNRCLNHLRRPVPAGQDSMDVFERDGGSTTADTVHKREEFRHIVTDVQRLPETQRTALLLREMDALSYEQIADAMDTTVPSVKSLLVRARVSLAEAGEARLLTCDEVRQELAEVAEGLRRGSAPVRRHLKTCQRCKRFRIELNRTNRALAALYPVGPAVLLHKLLLGLGAAGGGSAAAGGSGIAGGAATAGGAAGGGAVGASTLGSVAAVAGGGAGAATAGAVSAGIASKAAAGLAAAAIVTAGAVEVDRVQHRNVVPPAPVVAQQAPAPAVPVAVSPVDEEKEAVAVREDTVREREAAQKRDERPKAAEDAAGEDAAPRSEPGAVEVPTDPAAVPVPPPGAQAPEGQVVVPAPGAVAAPPPTPAPRIDPTTGGVAAPDPAPAPAPPTPAPVQPAPGPGPASPPGEPADTPPAVAAQPAPVAGEALAAGAATEQ